MTSPAPALPPSQRFSPRAGFGRVSVSELGRVMVSCAEGPFDVHLMSAVKRAIAVAGKRLPADQRLGDLVELRGSLEMDRDAWAQVNADLVAAGLPAQPPPPRLPHRP